MRRVQVFIIIFVLLLITSIGLSSEKQQGIKKYNETISDPLQVKGGLYQPLSLSEKIIKSKRTDAIRLRVKHNIGNELIYEIFLNGLNNKDQSKKSSQIQLMKIEQSKESIDNYFKYQKKRQEVAQTPLSKWDNSETRDKAELDNILQQIDNKVPPPSTIELNIKTTTINSPELKRRIENIELKTRKLLLNYPDRVNLLDGVTYILEIHNSLGFSYTSQLISTGKNDDINKIIREFIDIFNDTGLE